VHGAIPAHFELNRGGVIPTGAPAEMVVGLIDLEMEQAGLEGVVEVVVNSSAKRR